MGSRECLMRKKTIKTYSIIFSLDRVSIFLKLKASNILHELLYVPIYGIKLKFDNNSTSNISWENREIPVLKTYKSDRNNIKQVPRSRGHKWWVLRYESYLRASASSLLIGFSFFLLFCFIHDSICFWTSAAFAFLPPITFVAFPGSVWAGFASGWWFTYFTVSYSQSVFNIFANLILNWTECILSFIPI